VAGWFKVSCDRCTYQANAYDQGGVYRCTLNDTLTSAPIVRHKFAVCKNCARIVNAEVIPELEALQHEIERFASIDHADGIARLLPYIEWRSNRKSPPRCLECGSTTLTQLGLSQDGKFEVTEHPTCGGTLSIKWVGMALIRGISVYTAEGEFLGLAVDVFP
jgi:hypothetical protein